MKDLIKVAEEALSELSAAGADRAICTVRSSETREFNVDNGKFSLFRTLFNNGISMVAFVGNRRGSMSLNRFVGDAIKDTARQAVEVAGASQPDEAWDFAPVTENKEFRDGVLDADIDLLFERTSELLKDITERHPLIVIEQMIVSYSKARRVYANSKGVRFDEQGGEYNISLMYSAHDGELTSSFSSYDLTTLDLSTPFIECTTLDADLTDTENSIRTVNIGDKFEGTVLLTPSSLGSFLYPALSNFAGEVSLIDGTSIWKDKLGEKVADGRLTVRLAPLDPRIVCGERVTDDGFISEDYDLISSGVLRSFMLGMYSSNKTGFPRAKNTSFACVVEPGEKSLSDIVAQIDKGILIGRFSGGSPAPNGDFSGVAKNSFLIENGKITGALSETMVSGNLADMLVNIRDISRETVADGGSVLPYMAIGGVTVAGK